MQGGRGIGRPPSAKTADMLAMANGMMPLAPVGGASLGRPYGAKHLAGKLARGTAAELQTMIQMLNLRAAEIAMEMQTLQDLDKDGLGALQLESPRVMCMIRQSCTCLSVRTALGSEALTGRQRAAA